MDTDVFETSHTSSSEYSPEREALGEKNFRLLSGIYLDDLRKTKQDSPGVWSYDKELMDDLGESYVEALQENEILLRQMLSNESTRAEALAITKEVFMIHREYDDRKLYDDARFRKPERIRDLLSKEIYASISAIEKRLDGFETGNEVDDRQIIDYLYIVSEALMQFYETEKGRELEGWLSERFNRYEASLGSNPNSCIIERSDEKSTISQVALINFLRAADSFENVEPFKKVADQILDNYEMEPRKEGNIYQKAFACFLKRNDTQEGWLKKKQKDLCGMMLERIGISFSFSEKLIERWEAARNSGLWHDEHGVRISHPSYFDGIESLRALEKRQFGSARRLFDEFGIASFFRYDPDLLIRQLEEIDSDASYGVVVFSESDNNGAMRVFGDELPRICSSLQSGGYLLRIIEAESQYDLAKRIVRFDYRYGQAGKKISFMLVNAHGNPTSMQIGESKSREMDEYEDLEVEAYHQESVLRERRRKISIGDIQKGDSYSRAMRKYLTPEATIVLVSCSTGKEGGFAEQLSDISHKREVLAPSVNITTPYVEVSFDEKNIPVFDIQCQYADSEENLYLKYVDGRLIHM